MAEFDLAVIGAGPGGYVAAIRAAQLGLKVACIEKEPALGGTCLRVGCIPSKALLESSERYHAAKSTFAEHGIKLGDVKLDLPTMLKRKETIVSGLTKGIDGLFLKNKITRFKGAARFESPTKLIVSDGKQETEVVAKRVIIATGSKPSSLPGIVPDGDKIGTSTEALSYPQVPKHLVVIGAGYIGLELGMVWARLGSQVTVLEYLDRILPGMDAEIANDARKVFEAQGLSFKLGCKVTAAKVDKTGVKVEIADQPTISCDRVLMAVGRIPNTDGLGLDKIGLTLDQRGRIPVQDGFQTAVPGVYAIGDVIVGPMLAHKAEEEGVACVEQMVTGYGHVNYDAIPGVVYTEPEVATVGKTEEQLKEQNIPYRKGTFPFKANARARALGMTDGKVKILAHKETDRVLGVHIIGPRAGDLIAEAVVAIEFGASAEDIARSSHAHPTLAECIKEAAFAVDGRTIHM